MVLGMFVSQLHRVGMTIFGLRFVECPPGLYLISRNLRVLSILNILSQGYVNQTSIPVVIISDIELDRLITCVDRSKTTVYYQVHV